MNHRLIYHVSITELNDVILLTTARRRNVLGYLHGSGLLVEVQYCEPLARFGANPRRMRPTSFTEVQPTFECMSDSVTGMPFDPLSSKIGFEEKRLEKSALSNWIPHRR